MSWGWDRPRGVRVTHDEEVAAPAGYFAAYTVDGAIVRVGAGTRPAAAADASAACAGPHGERGPAR